MRLSAQSTKATATRNRPEVLTLLIQEYEREHYPIPDPEPIDFLLHVMDASGLPAVLGDDPAPVDGPRHSDRGADSTLCCDPDCLKYCQTLE